MEEKRRNRNRSKRRAAIRKKRRNRRIALGVMGAVLLVLLIMVVSILIQSRSQSQRRTASSAAKSSSDKKTDVGKENNKSSDITISLQGSQDITMKLGDAFQELGFKAEDKDGKDVSEQVQVDTSELNCAGERRVIYTASDKNGVEAKAVRKVTVTPNKELPTNGLPICMYHYVYDSSNPPENVDANFIDVNTLEEELKYLHENDYYFPTWKEVREYIDGERILPDKSIVITFDDGPNYMYLGIPALEKYQVPATSFVITSYYDSKEMLYGYSSDYLTFESHSYKMHQGGGNIGHGGIFLVMSREDALADLKQSIELCGNGNAFAYPFGDYSQEARDTLEEAGFLCAVTTENGKGFPGDDPLTLPRIRMSGGQTLEEFIEKIQ